MLICQFPRILYSSQSLYIVHWGLNILSWVWQLRMREYLLFSKFAGKRKCTVCTKDASMIPFAGFQAFQIVHCMQGQRSVPPKDMNTLSAAGPSSRSQTVFEHWFSFQSNLSCGTGAALLEIQTQSGFEQVESVVNLTGSSCGPSKRPAWGQRWRRSPPFPCEPLHRPHHTRLYFRAVQEQGQEGGPKPCKTMQTAPLRPFTWPRSSSAQRLDPLSPKGRSATDSSAKDTNDFKAEC